MKRKECTMATNDKFTTMEHLSNKVSATYGAVLKFGNRVFVTDAYWKGGFTAAIYEFVETSEETGLGDIECRLVLIAQADQHFEDGGHAIAWCLKQKELSTEANNELKAEIINK